MWHVGLTGLSALVAALLIPGVWFLVRIAGGLPFLLRLTDLRLYPLHLMAGLAGCLLGWALLRFLAAPYGGRDGRNGCLRFACLAGGFVGAAISSLLFFPLVALF